MNEATTQNIVPFPWRRLALFVIVGAPALTLAFLLFYGFMHG
jgi:hypothetical protein